MHVHVPIYVCVHVHTHTRARALLSQYEYLCSLQFHASLSSLIDYLINLLNDRLIIYLSLFVMSTPWGNYIFLEQKLKTYCYDMVIIWSSSFTTKTEEWPKILLHTTLKSKRHNLYFTSLLLGGKNCFWYLRETSLWTSYTSVLNTRLPKVTKIKSANNILNKMSTLSFIEIKWAVWEVKHMQSQKPIPPHSFVQHILSK